MAVEVLRGRESGIDGLMGFEVDGGEGWGDMKEVDKRNTTDQPDEPTMKQAQQEPKPAKAHLAYQTLYERQMRLTLVTSIHSSAV